MLLLDTHVVHWLASNDARLGKKVRRLIEATAPERLSVSAVSFWELGQLLRKKGLDPPIVGGIAGLRAGLTTSGYRLLDLTLHDVFSADSLVGFHGDTGDRFLVGTALAAGFDFVTADRKILAWSGSLRRIDAQS